MLAIPVTDSKSKKFSANIASGGLAGATSLTFVYPLEYARTRLSNNTKNNIGERQFSGYACTFLCSLLWSFSTCPRCVFSVFMKLFSLRDVFSKTYRSDGFRGLYRGFTTSVVGIIVYRGLYFGLYDTLKPSLGTLQNNIMANFLLGWGITISAGLAFYPFDTVCRHIFIVLRDVGVSRCVCEHDRIPVWRVVCVRTW